MSMRVVSKKRQLSLTALFPSSRKNQSFNIVMLLRKLQPICSLSYYALYVLRCYDYDLDEGVINETEEEHREVIAKLGKLREYVENLNYQDRELEKLCRERFSIIADIMQVYDYADVLQNVSLTK